jgi:hypothetical protein
MASKILTMEIATHILAKDTITVLPGIENSALFVFHSHKIIVKKFVYIVKPVVLHKGLAGRSEPS